MVVDTVLAKPPWLEVEKIELFSVLTPITILGYQDKLSLTLSIIVLY